MPFLSPSSPYFSCWLWFHVIWDVPWVQLCSFWAPCAPRALSMVEWCEKQKSPCCCKHSLTRLKHPCVISTVCFTNPKQLNIWAAVEKIIYPNQDQHTEEALFLFVISDWKSWTESSETSMIMEDRFCRHILYSLSARYEIALCPLFNVFAFTVY